MKKLDWPRAVEAISGRVVRLQTPTCSGTGFVLSGVKDSNLTIVATAAHVLAAAHEWEQPIRLVNGDTSVLLHASDRGIVLDDELDTAVLLVPRDAMPPPERTLELSPEGRHLLVGHEVGWLGFPALPLAGLSFFSGRISCLVESKRSYLVDGVAVNGVSGGPAFNISAENRLIVIGVVTAYLANRQPGETLPGLCVIQDVAQLQEVVKDYASVDDAKKAGAVSSKGGGATGQAGS